MAMAGAVLAPAGCAWLGISSADPESVASTGVPSSDQVQVQDRRLDLATGPWLDYRTYKPVAAQPEHGAHRPWVVLAHGFLRDQRRMRGLAMALAEAGFPVATLNGRQDSLLSGGHVAHSRDMVKLARALDAERVIYAGFSAGGLAALLAARQDHKAEGVLTLDLVDSQGLGRRAANGLGAPLLALVGAPSNCNADNNAAPIYEIAPLARVTPIPQASHCDFESPSDWLCRLVCEQSPDSTRNRTLRQPRGHGETSPVQRQIIQAAVTGIRQLADSRSR